VGTPNDAAARSHYYQCVLAIDGDLTTIRIGPVTIAASGRAVDDNRPTTFLCTATARLTRPNPTMPALSRLLVGGHTGTASTVDRERLNRHG
jgi:hypothetical protein